MPFATSRFQGHRLFDTGEETLRRIFFFTIFECGGHFGHVTKIFNIKLSSPSLQCSTSNLALIGLAVLEKKPIYSPGAGAEKVLTS